MAAIYWTDKDGTEYKTFDIPRGRLGNLLLKSKEDHEFISCVSCMMHSKLGKSNHCCRCNDCFRTIDPQRGIVWSKLWK